MSDGEIREAIRAADGSTYVVGERLATQGAEGCRDVRCTRRNGVCIGWHCARCGKPSNSQGDCGCRAEADR